MRRHRASPPALVVSVAADLVGSGVRHRARRPLWCALVLLHGVCTAFPCAVGLVYLALPRHGTTVLYNAEMYDVSVSRRYFKTIAVVYFLVAGLHAAHLLQIIATSLRYRSLLLEAPEQQRLRRASAGSGRLNLRRLISGWTARAAVRTGPRLPPEITEPQRGSVDSPSVVQDSGRRSSSSVGRLVALWSALDIMDPNYDTTNLLREVVETVVLTVQAYRASYLVPRPWVNNTLVALLVLNCWSVPIVQGFFGAKVLRARLVGLLINTVLDVVYYIVVPTVLFLPYYREFDVSWSGFHPRCWFSSRWLISAITEWQMLFVTSVWDAVSKLFIALSIYRALLTITGLVRRRERNVRATTLNNASVLPQPILMPRRRQDACKTGAKSPKNKRAAVPRNIRATATPIARDVAPVKRLRGFVVRQLHHALIVWGAVVLVSHLHAASHHRNAQCVTRLRPWFARQATCSLMILDCRATVGNIETGAAAEFDRVLSAIDPRWLASLTIRHCPHVEITPTFLRLHALMGFKIFNSTLMRWDDDAALSRKHHPQAKVVHLLQTSMAALPAGLYGREFPPWLQDIEILECNVTHLPLEVADAWAEVTLLKLEGLAFADGHVPEALTRLRPTFLALSLNGLTSLPRELMENPRLSALSICANPISELPEEVRVVPPLSLLLVDWTNVSELPSWVETRFLVGSGSNSPLCQTLVTLQADQVAMDERLSQLQQRIYCKPFDGDPRWLFQYPLLAESFFNP
ncbi:hypothetical protein PINS_up009494 [Pythium insidiosum]|nr:hypothetical protein PINS_up009494 [Pythium insidiosum]